MTNPDIARYTGRADYMVFPVSLLCSMPEEWRSHFAKLIDEYNDRFEVGSAATYEVNRTDISPDPYGYRHDRFEPESAWENLQQELRAKSSEYKPHV